MSTSELWVATHRALSNARWPEARALLDALGQRDDNRDTLASFESYAAAADHPLEGLAGAGLRSLMQDRIDLVNSKAQR